MLVITESEVKKLQTNRPPQRTIGGFFRLVFERINEANINSSSIVIAYYGLLAIFPLIIMIGNILPFLDINSLKIFSFLNEALPDNIYALLAPLLRVLLSGGSGKVASISGLIILWAASRGFNALKQALNFAFGVGKTQGFLTLHLFSLLLTIFFEFVVIILFVMYSFGQFLLNYLTPLFHFSPKTIHAFVNLKGPTTFLSIFIILALLYYLLPNAKVHVVSLLPGALVATLGWFVLTMGFSLYVKHFVKSVALYGPLGSFIVLLFWLNYTSWIILLGGGVTAAFEYFFFGKPPIKRYRLKNVKNKVKTKLQK